MLAGSQKNTANLLATLPCFYPHKPKKVRQVFDFSAVYKGKSPNKQLLKGPDLINYLVGVLTRFRKRLFSSQMSRQWVDPKDCTFLRFCAGLREI